MKNMSTYAAVSLLTAVLSLNLNAFTPKAMDEEEQTQVQFICEPEEETKGDDSALSYEDAAPAEETQEVVAAEDAAL